MLHEYVFRYEDYLNARRLYVKRRIGARLLRYFLLYLLPLMLLLSDALQLYAMRQREDEVTLGILFSFVAPFAMFAFALGLARWSQRRVFRSMIAPGEEEANAVFGFSEEGVESAIPGMNEGRYAWRSVLEFAEDEDVGILFVRKNMYLVIPKRAMREEDWFAFERLSWLEQAGMFS